MTFVDSEDAQWRASLGESRYELAGDELRVIPRFTRAMGADLEFRELPAEDVCASDFQGLFTPGSEAWREYFSSRKVVSRAVPYGPRLLSVTSAVADALDSRKPALRGKARGEKVYELVHLLTDVSLAEKFQVTGSFKANMRNLAVVDTARAARRMEEHVRSFDGYQRAVVDPGRYASSWKAARDALKLFAAAYPVTSVRVDACFIGDKIFMYGEQGEDGWRVFGPERCASLVKLVHRMVEASSCEAVIFAFGPELTILDIDVHDGDMVLSPVRERHAGSHDALPLVSGEAVGATLSSSDRPVLLTQCAACEVVALDGEDCATAVRVTSQYLLVNSHVLAEGGTLTVSGRPATAHRMVTSDLWVVRCWGPEVAWHLRDPVEGESVYLCYRRHEQLQMAGPVRLVGFGGGMLTLEKVAAMSPGVSGAAVVAASDFALLGLYDGVTLRRGLAAQFTADMYTDLCTMSEQGDSSHASASRDEGSVYDRLKKRGLGRVAGTVFDALEPLYSGDVHVGMGVKHGGFVYTVCDPDVSPLASSVAAQPHVFRRTAGACYVAPVPGLAAPGPAVVRAPAYGEAVVVVGRDGEGEYVSKGESRVVHVGLNAESFQIAPVDLNGALPLTGGLVLALSDAAVVGVYRASKHEPRRGTVGVCVAYPALEAVKSERENPAAVVQRVFPFLRPGVWPEDALKAAVRHGSMAGSTMSAMAMVGDSAMRTALWTRLLEKGVPTSEWQTYAQRDQCNARQAEVAVELGLDRLLELGRGVSVQKGSKVYADLLESVGAMVYLHDTAEAFETFCEKVGAIRVDSG